MRISNDSVSAVIRSFAVALVNGNTIVWLEIAPQHPKVVGALWATLVNNTSARLTIEAADEKYIRASGLHRKYHRLPVDAPRLAGRARPKFLRLVAPEACAITDPKQPFIALEWPGRSIGQSLAAMLERGTPYPMQIGWGDYLLRAAIAGEYAERLITGGPAPQGYLFDKDTPWREFIAEGVKRGHLKLDGTATGDLLPLTEEQAEAPLEVEDEILEEDDIAEDEGELSDEEERAIINAAIERDGASMARSFTANHPGARVEVIRAPRK